MRFIGGITAVILTMFSLVAHSDQNTDIYDGIVAEAGAPRSNSAPGLQTQAIFFVSTMTNLSKDGMLWQSPLKFTLSENSSDGTTSLLGTSKIMYKVEGPNCIRVDITINAHMPTHDDSYRNIYVESVNLQVSAPFMCV